MDVPPPVPLVNAAARVHCQGHPSLVKAQRLGGHQFRDLKYCVFLIFDSFHQKTKITLKMLQKYCDLHTFIVIFLRF